MPNLNNLEKLLEEDGRGSKAKLAKAINVSTGNISDWFNSNKTALPSASALCKIADYYNCSVDYLLGRTNNPKTNDEPTKIYRFPVYEQKAAAGIGQLSYDSEYDMEEYIIDNIPNKAVFAMKIKGDSMYDKRTGHIKSGATVLINPKETDYENKIVIASLDNIIVCKRYTIIDNHVEFISDNTEKQDENKNSLDYNECKIIGVVLGVIEDDRFIEVK